MNYKIRITAENQAIVKRIADENGMNPKQFLFTEFDLYYLIVENKFWTNDYESDYSELTTEQFIELFDKKETEIDKWLRETKAKNLSLEELFKLIANTGETKFGDIFCKLKGGTAINKAQILFNQWNNPTEESTKVEIEWQPKRGDRVLVWDNSEERAKIRIFLTKIEGSANPIVVVYNPDEESFLNNEEFDTTQFKHMKPLPIEQPKETDFKTKVIELIEKNINDKQEKLKFVIDKNNLIYEAVLECIVEIQKDLLKQIKEL